MISEVAIDGLYCAGESAGGFALHGLGERPYLVASQAGKLR